jgi:uncharacterized protein YjbI with pentapeptide repeats
MSQVRLIIFVAAFITLTGNSKLLEKTLLVYPISEYLLLFVCSLLIWFFVFLSALLLIFCYRPTIKPILIISLMISSVVSYAMNNFGIVFDHIMIANTFETNTTEFLELVNFKSFLYLFILGLLPSYFVIKTEITGLTLKSQLRQRAKAFVIMLLIFILLIIGFSKLVDFPLRKNHPIKIHLIDIAKAAIPLKNLILMRNVDDKIALLKSSGSCVFCNLTQGNFKESDLKGVDLRYANLSGADLSNANLSGANLINVNLSGADLSNVSLNGANLNGVDLRNTDLTGVNLSEVDLRNTDLTGTILTFANLLGANLDGVDLSNKDLTGVNLSGVDLSEKDLTGIIFHHANLSGVNLSNSNLTGTSLVHANLSWADLTGTNLINSDLTGAILSGVDLSNKDLTGTILTFANLSGANLDGVDLRNKDLTGADLSGVDLSNKDLTGTILQDAKKIEISLKQPSNSNWPALIADQNLNVIRYDLSGDVQYIATKEGFLFESKNNESRLVLDLNNDAQFPFYNERLESGLFGIASQNKLVYVAYSSKDINGAVSLVVDEYSMNFSKVRNIIKIVGFPEGYYGANLLFDSLGKLYLSVGDSGYTNQAQDLNSLKGKILRLDVSKSKLEPEIVAYGIRVPWGVTIDSKDRMFILDCGHYDVEAVYLLNDLYSGVPANLGWPVFEGSMRKLEDPLKFNDILAPIFEYYIRPGCVTGGVYLDDLESFLLGDYYGIIRLLKQKEDGDWYLFHEYKHEEFMNNDEFGRLWGFGLDEKTKKIFVAPDNLELEISVDQVNLNQ